MLFRYSATIIDTGLLTENIDDIITKIVAGTPERIAQYVTSSWNPPGLDSQLETINSESGAYHRLQEDTEAQEALLRYYVDTSRRWYDAQEQMRKKLRHVKNRTGEMEVALKYLDKRIGDIKPDRK